MCNNKVSKYLSMIGIIGCGISLYHDTHIAAVWFNITLMVVFINWYLQELIKESKND